MNETLQSRAKVVSYILNNIIVKKLYFYLF